MNKFMDHLKDKSPTFICYPAGGRKAPDKTFEIGHKLNDGASDDVLKLLEDKLSGDSKSIIEFYRKHNGAELYCQDDMPSIEFFKIEDMNEKNKQWKEWFDIFDEEELEDALFEFQKKGFAFGEISFSANYFIFYEGKIYYSNHDGGDDSPAGNSFEEFLENIMRQPAQFLYDMGCYTRLSDGETDIQWIPREYLPDGEADIQWIPGEYLSDGCDSLGTSSNPKNEILKSLENIEFVMPQEAEDLLGLFNALYASFTLGDWQSCREFIDILRENTDTIRVLLELSIKEAQLDVIDGNLSEGLKKLEHLKQDIDSNGPGYYEARLSNLYKAAGDLKNYLKSLESAATISNNEPIILIDLALAEAMFGSNEKAKNIINMLDTTDLPPFGDTYIKITQGIISIQEDSPMALEKLESAMLDLIQHSSNPAFWSILVLCSVWYALADKACGNIKEAENIICHVWPVLSADPDKTFFNKIKAEMPGIEEIIKSKLTSN